MCYRTIFFRQTECNFFVHNTTPYIHPRPGFDWPRQFRLDGITIYRNSSLWCMCCGVAWNGTAWYGMVCAMACHSIWYGMTCAMEWNGERHSILCSITCFMALPFVMVPFTRGMTNDSWRSSLHVQDPFTHRGPFSCVFRISETHC